MIAPFLRLLLIVGLSWTAPSNAGQRLGAGVGDVFFLPLDREEVVVKVWGDVEFYPEARGEWGRSEAHPAHRRGPSVGAGSNAVFEVGPSVAPRGPLRINLDTRRGEAALAQQAYLLVEVLDETGLTMPGFCAEQCMFVGVNELGAELRWAGRTTASLAGQTIKLRFHARDMRLYSLHNVDPPPEKSLAHVRLGFDSTKLAAWESTNFVIQGVDDEGRALRLDEARVRLLKEPEQSGLHLKPDQREQGQGSASVPAEVLEAVSVKVRAQLTLAGVTVVSPPVELALRPAEKRSSVEVSGKAVQLFMRPADVVQMSGPVEFRANTLSYYAETEGLPTTVLAMTVFNREIGGRYHVWGSSREEGGLFRAETQDGVRFKNVRLLRSEIAPRHLMTMAYNPLEGRYLAFERVLKPLRWRAHFSEDGTEFVPVGAAIYHDHDATNLLWDEAGKRFLALAVTYQQLKERRRYHDNLRWEEQLEGGVRRVLSIRQSVDGIHWAPETDVFQGRPETWLKCKYLIEPDADDPPDLEHYWFNGFRYRDRWLGMVMTYAPSPAVVLERHPYDPYPSKHGPHLGTEWWISDDGVTWERPYRGTPATPDLRIYFSHAPLILHNRLLFLMSNQIYNLPPEGGGPGYHGARPGQNMEVYSLPVDRIASAGSQSAASFMSRPLVMPRDGLALNYEHDGMLAVELVDEQGRPLPGYGKDDGQLPSGSHGAAPISWRGRIGKEHAGKMVSVRFYSVRARVYALYH